jgi:hypothetical protein
VVVPQGITGDTSVTELRERVPDTLDRLRIVTAVAGSRNPYKWPQPLIDLRRDDLRELAARMSRTELVKSLQARCGLSRQRAYELVTAALATDALGGASS